MFRLTLILTLLTLFYSSSNALAKTTKATPKTTKATSNTTKTASNTTVAPEKLFCASCSYEYTFAEIRNRSNWLSPWSRCQNQTATNSTFGATACHTLIRIDYAHQYVTIYYNASYRSLKKLPTEDRRIVFETIMGTNASRAQLKAFYECSFEDNCHLPLKRYLQLRSALRFVDYNYKKLIQRLVQFYGKPKKEVLTYFHADTLTSTLNGYCGHMDRFDKESTKTVKPVCLKKEDKLKSKTVDYDSELTATVYTCNGTENTFCGSEKKMKEFLNVITLTDYLRNFFGWHHPPTL